MLGCCRNPISPPTGRARIPCRCVFHDIFTKTRRAMSWHSESRRRHARSSPSPSRQLGTWRRARGRRPPVELMNRLGGCLGAVISALDSAM